MKKVFFLLLTAGSLVACDNAGSTADKKDSLDSVANVKKDVIDSSAEAKKDVVDSTTDKMKNAVEKQDSAMKSATDSTKK